MVDPGPPPDGGWIVYRQILGGFLVVFLCWGFINSFGLFVSDLRKLMITESQTDLTLFDRHRVGLANKISRSNHITLPARN